LPQVTRKVRHDNSPALMTPPRHRILAVCL